MRSLFSFRMRPSKRSKACEAPEQLDASLGENEWDDQPVASASRSSFDDWDVISRVKLCTSRLSHSDEAYIPHQRSILFPSTYIHRHFRRLSSQSSSSQLAHRSLLKIEMLTQRQPRRAKLRLLTYTSNSQAHMHYKPI